jgi:hypothetical protein
VSPDVSLGVAPPKRDDPTPRPWLALVAAVMLLLLGTGLWWLWPAESSGDPPGRAAIGDAPGTGSVGVALPEGQALNDQSGSPGDAVAPAPPANARPGNLVVRVEVPQTGPLGYSLRVTISNAGDTAESWRSVALRLSGANLTVTPGVTAVTYEFHTPAHCLVAASRVALAAGESITLDASVTALLPDALGNVESARLDEAPCPV